MRPVAAWHCDQIGGERGQRVNGAGGQRGVQPLVELGRVEPAVGDGGARGGLPGDIEFAAQSRQRIPHRQQDT